ncbi:hypothetical protein F3Y22_tig00110418pilonHSYRG00018 [Hibiscus syriacus]|uniref:Uncharacterized protein n=1 Tax=Hibiscus syriacus TaxID=106335 RepID=A0A6A3AM50_HIBSY|nr:hypothetical protein F3Y22_tig00110418pilonHSYRG00018 [Hibiscus syriacus]
MQWLCNVPPMVDATAIVVYYERCSEWNRWSRSTNIVITSVVDALGDCRIQSEIKTEAGRTLFRRETSVVVSVTVVILASEPLDLTLRPPMGRLLLGMFFTSYRLMSKFVTAFNLRNLIAAIS